MKSYTLHQLGLEELLPNILHVRNIKIPAIMNQIIDIFAYLNPKSDFIPGIYFSDGKTGFSASLIQSSISQK